MKPARAQRLARFFDALALEYRNDLSKEDLMPLARHYDHPKDREIAAFLCATLSFGPPDVARAKVKTLLASLGPKPARLIIKSNQELLKEICKDLSWQFVPEEGLELFLSALRGVLKKHVTLDGLMHYCRGEKNNRPLWSSLDRFASLILRTVSKEDLARTRMGHFVPRPSKGTQVERLQLFLKMVTRPADDYDLGLWTTVRPAELLMPINTRILEYARHLKLTTSELPNRTSCVGLTSQLLKINPQDPVSCHAAFLRMIQLNMGVDDLHDRFRRA
jgi:uncharacterized protein (TIGR02757 family)